MFSLTTGVPATLPATQPVPVHRVRVEGDDVLVTVDGGDA
jgi:nitrite reductase/ring-hydroxylating ferredoxin subunit